MSAQVDAADTSAEAPPLDTIALPPADAGAVPARVDEPAAMEPMVVTAQKREENIRDVPISIQAFSGASLAARGIASTRQLDQAVPSLQFSSVAGFPLVFIRGLGTDNFIPSADPSIATYVDGIYVPNGAATLQSLSSIERVEVLKGPQGTLFGRNATGGAITVLTQEPAQAWAGAAEGQVGNFDARSARVSLSGPLDPSVLVGLSAESSRKRAYYRNFNYAVPQDRLDAVRLKLVLKPDDAVSLSLNGYHSSQSGLFFSLYENAQPSAFGMALGVEPTDLDYHADTDYPGDTSATQDIGYATLTWRLPRFDFKLLASVQHHFARGQADFDGSPRALAGLSTSNVFTDLRTAEAQLLSNDDSWGAGRFKWVAGVYALKSSAGIDPGFLQTGPGVLSALLARPELPALAQLGERMQELLTELGLKDTPLGDSGISLAYRGALGTESYSAYADGTLKLGERVDFTLGGRLQRERRYLTRAQTDLANPVGAGTTPLLEFPLQQAHETNFAPRAVLGLHPSARSLVYLSYSVAYKSGTYNIVNIYRPPDYLVPERVTSYEIGAKTELAGGSLRLDAALFDSEIRNLQSGFTSLLSGGVVQFFSVPQARSRGAEINLGWLPLPVRDPGLALSFNAAYVDAIYTDYPHGPGYDETTGVYSGDMDHTGNQLTYNPRVSGNLGAVQTLHGARGLYELALDEYYNSGTFSSAQNSVEQPPYAVLNARVGYHDLPWKLRLTLFCQNLFDRRYFVLVSPNDFGIQKTFAAPREYGLRLSWEF